MIVKAGNDGSKGRNEGEGVLYSCYSVRAPLKRSALMRAGEMPMVSNALVIASTNGVMPQT